jgi:alpha/beta superfamily hydrolase
VRHDVADSLALMSFSLGASVAVAVVFALATRLAW